MPEITKMKSEGNWAQEKSGDREGKTLSRMNADARGSEEIAGIAVIARHRRNRKGKISPRRHGDTEKIGDRKNQKTYRGWARINADQKRSPASP
jgi:hypothetical protein